MVGKKKTKDIQFFREALESLVDETSGRRNRMRWGDEDEIAQEREERKRRAEANAEFKAFAEKAVEMSKSLDVEIPYRELGFTGVFAKQNVLLQPTTECLVQVVEPPFLVVPLGEVEIAYLERVMFGLKNFDIVFVFKDHTQPPVSVNSVPVSSLEPIKEWLDSVDVLYAESKVNFNWTNILKMIAQDPIDFYETGGWANLQPDADGEDGVGGDDEDSEEPESSEYEPDEDDDEEDEEEEEEDDEDEEEDEYDEDEDEDDEDEDSEEDEEEESEGPDWDELEAEAAREDARRHGPTSASSTSAKRKVPQAPPKSKASRR